MAKAPVRLVALLKGVNVGGNKKVPMADLRALLAGLGYTDVATYVQSGNAVFTAPGGDSHAEAIESAIEEQFGFAASVLVRTRAEIDATIAANPFAPEAAADPKKVHALFVASAVDPARLDALDLPSFAPETLAVGDGVLYAHLPDGMGRSRLAPLLTDRKLGTVVTARNWRTVEALADLLRG